jgi:hypothetical protein
MRDLNLLVDLPDGVFLASVQDINNAGQVIATAIPELESYALMLAGLVLIQFKVRRKPLGVQM